MNNSKYFKLDEFIESDTARKNNIDNTPNESVKENIKSVMFVMDEIRTYVNKPIRITSGFRCNALNEKVGGVANSIHKTGLACDFTFDNIRENQMKEIAIYVKDNIKEFDQLIIYPDRNFIHFNLRDNPRNMLLESLGKGKYKKLEV